MDRKLLKVGVFVPCCVDQFGVGIAQNMVNILKERGLECRFEEGLTCCGERLYSHGDHAGARQLGGGLLEAFADCSHVVTCSSGCAAYVRHDLGSLFANTPLYARGVDFASRFYDFSDFMVNVLNHTASGCAFPHKVALVDHGRSRRDYGKPEAPRQLLSSLEGLELCEVGDLDADLLYASAFPDTAMAMVERTVRKAQECGAQYIVATEPRLLLLLKGYCSKTGINIKCRHIIDILAL